MGIVALIRESMVEMPERAGRGHVVAAIDKIREVTEAARRAAEQRACEAFRKAHANDDPTIRHCTRYDPYDFLSGDQTPHQRISSSDPKQPPNLHAAVLSFPARLLTLVKEKCGGNAAMAYKRAGVRRNTYSRLVSSDYESANKRTVMQFCIGLQLSRPEADLLMKAAGFAFSDTIPVDCAFVYCIEHCIWNLDDINEILSANGLPVIEVE